MKIKKFLKKTKGVFVPPKKNYYIGKLAYGTPYFYPINFSSSILKIRKLKLRDDEEYLERCRKQPWNKESNRFTNVPMARRSKDWIFKMFGSYFWLELGWPIMVHEVELGWKWKFDSIRFEWVPSFQVYFFNWQFVITWHAPDDDDDLYYEQALWYLKGADKNIEKARETWGWTNYDTKESTWNDNYIVK